MTIVTHSVILTRRFIHQLRQQRETGPPAPIGIIFGEVGLGKTIAAQAYLGQLPRSVTTTHIKITTLPYPTPAELVGQVANSLKDPGSARRARAAPLSTAIELIKLDKIELIIFDDAENFGRKTLQLVTKIHQATNITIILLVSGQTINEPLSTLNNIEKLALPAPTLQEIIGVVLPALPIFGWSYDPTNPQHRWLGEYLWNQVKPSFRALRLILQLVSLGGQPIDQAAIDKLLSKFLRSG